MSKISDKFSKIMLCAAAAFSFTFAVADPKQNTAGSKSVDADNFMSILQQIQKSFIMEDFDVYAPLFEFEHPVTKKKITLNLLQMIGLTKIKYEMMDKDQQNSLKNKVSIVKSVDGFLKRLAFYQEYKDKLTSEDVKEVDLMYVGAIDAISNLADIAIIRHLGNKEGILKDIKKYFADNPDLNKTFSFIVVKGNDKDIKKVHNNLKDKKDLTLAQFEKVVTQIMGSKYDKNDSKYSNKSLGQIERGRILNPEGARALKDLEEKKISKIISIEDKLSCIIYLLSTQKQKVDYNKALPQYLSNKIGELMDKVSSKKAAKLTDYFIKQFGGEDLEKISTDLSTSLNTILTEKMLKKSDKDDKSDKDSKKEEKLDEEAAPTIDKTSKKTDSNDKSDKDSKKEDKEDKEDEDAAPTLS